MNRMLIVGCSAKKDAAEGLLGALDRYRGAYYQMINQIPRQDLPEVVILSAEFGFISGRQEIPDYNRRMDRRRAEELLVAPQTARQLADLVKVPLEEIFVAAGADYRRVILPLVDALFPEVAVRVASGGIGYQRRGLKEWLREHSV